ncbi:restriction endonuclease subunit S [Aggregatibacter segnis]|uniref:restriction endonuclease subunit S n=1 Tax=Aggregatibacter segnis TaxID=739 RepID=UPI003F9FC881
MTTEQQLPEGWKIERLGDIAISEKGKKPKNQSSEKTDTYCYPYVDIEAFEKGVIKSYTDGVKCVLCDEDDFLMVWDGSRSGLVGKGIRGALGSTLVRISLPEVSNLYAYYFLLSKYQEINTRAKGSGTPHVDPDLLWNYAFPIPPNLETQQAIVNKIESLFDEIDEGIGRLKTAAQQIQQYRQSLLKNAFNGELTKEWRSKHADTLPSENELLAQIQATREQHHAQQLADWQTAVSQWEQNGKEGKKPSKPKAPTQAVKFEENFADLPKGWIWGKLSDLGELARGKSKHRPRNDKKLFGGRYPFIQTGEVRAANRIIKKYEQTYSEFGLEQSKLWQKGTLCITIAANIAETAFLGFDACFPDSIVGFSASKAVLPEYIELFIKSARTRIESYAPATAQKNINLNTLENLIVPYCSLAEQTQIVAILESKLTACDQLAAELAKQLKQAELLKQAVLKAAFSGSLLDK